MISCNFPDYSCIQKPGLLYEFKFIVFVPFNSITANTLSPSIIAPSAFLLSFIFLSSVLKLKSGAGLIVYPRILQIAPSKNLPEILLLYLL